MAKLTLSPIGSFSQSAITTINQNMDDIETALENTLSRDGTTPNQMAADLDMNTKDLLNVGTTNTTALMLNGSLVLSTPVTSTSAAALLTLIKTVDGAGSGLDADLLDGIDSSAFMQKANNLSDVANKVTSFANLNSQRVAGSSTYSIIDAQSKANQYVDLRDWAGLDLTGVTDMTTIVQAAVTSTAAAGQVLRLPPGKIRLTAAITCPFGTNIQGPKLPSDRNGVFSADSTYFYLDHTGIGFNLTGQGASSSGPLRRLAGFGTYRNQAADTGGWTPTATSADVTVTGAYDVVLEDLFFYNATRAITVTGDLTGSGAGNGRICIRRIRGQPMLYGLNLTHIYDTIYVDDVHWWPYWSFGTNILAYMKANATACLLQRVDWPQFGRMFSWGLRDGIQVVQQASVGLDGSLPPGTTTALHMDSLGVDNCERGLVVGSGADGFTASFDHIYCTNTTYASSNMLTFAANNARVVILDLYAANADGGAVTITGTGNDVTIGRHRSSGIDHDANNTPEFNVATGTNVLTLLAKPITSAGTVYAFAGTGRIRTPDWIAFTPTISASTGTITTISSIDCKYQLQNTTCIFDYTFVITTNGTGAGTLQATLPFSSKKVTAAGFGRAGAVMINGLAQSGGTARCDILKYDGTYPGADATTVRITGTYEIA